MTREETQQQIDRELTTARSAQHAGNDGMARVCARRAAGVAVSYWLQDHPHLSWGTDAMNQLRELQREETMPPHVREAAMHLAARVTENFTSPFPADPVNDCLVIISHLMGSS